MNRKRKLQLKLPRDAESRRILKRSLIFEEMNRELEEIEKLMWLESEKAGKDIGFEKAFFQWIYGHRNLWRSARMRKQFRKRP